MTFQALSSSIDFEEVLSKSQLSQSQKKAKALRDQELREIIERKSDKFLVIIGPCSAHEEEAVCDYAGRLAALQEKLKDKLFLIPRIYTNKPRTNGDGYKGLLHQQSPGGKVNLVKGLESVRHLHHRVITETGLTTADEMLYPENLEFIQDLLSYIAVGARSVEDQQHRFVASGIDQPVGMKNPTSGNLNVLFHSLHAAQQKQEFIFAGKEVATSSNPLAHVVLRGGVDETGTLKPNYHYEDLLKVLQFYQQGGYQNPFVVIDTNHDNSGKQQQEQIRIVKETLINRTWNKEVHDVVRGFMIESFIESGKQEVDGKIYGQSITDPCLSWADTEKLLYYIAENV